MSHLHFNSGGDRHFAASIRDHLPVRLIELRTMDVFIIRAHKSGFADRFEIAGSVADDMTNDRHPGLSGKGPVVSVRSGIEFQGQQLVGGCWVWEAPNPRELLGGAAVSCVPALPSPASRSLTTTILAAAEPMVRRLAAGGNRIRTVSPAGGVGVFVSR